MGPWLNFAPPEGINLFEAASSGQVINLKVKGPLGVPLGRYPLRIKRLEEGKGFLEQTKMLPFLLWQHEREIESESGSTRITDQLGWRWKVTVFDPVFRVGVRLFFRHRHRQLNRRFGPAG